MSCRHDGAILSIHQARIAFTTDSYVIQPLFFPGGNIDTLAVNGTVNDLAMCGARPLYLSARCILEEGFSMAILQEIVVDRAIDLLTQYSTPSIIGQVTASNKGHVTLKSRIGITRMISRLSGEQLPRIY